jgi:hypothetical protein
MVRIEDERVGGAHVALRLDLSEKKEVKIRLKLTLAFSTSQHSGSKSVSEIER